MSLTKQYDNGKVEIPPDGRYLVYMKIDGQWQVVLEKKIGGRVGTNHLPIFGLRHVDIPFMDFDILLTGIEIIFKYRNGLITDRLRRIGDKWLGKLFYRNNFTDWFWLKEK